MTSKINIIVLDKVIVIIIILVAEEDDDFVVVGKTITLIATRTRTGPMKKTRIPPPKFH